MSVHQLRRNIVLYVAYVCNRADDLLLFANYNQAFPNNAAGTIPLQDRRPIPSYSDITYAFNGGRSRYHALQAKWEWRMSREVTLLSSLTLSETRDNGSQSLENSNGNNPSPQDFRNMDADFGLSNYHQPYNSTTSFVWSLPFGHDRRWGSAASQVVNALIGGWEIAGINSVFASEPVTFIYNPGATLEGTRTTEDVGPCRLLLATSAILGSISPPRPCRGPPRHLRAASPPEIPPARAEEPIGLASQDGATDYAKPAELGGDVDVKGG